MGDEREHYSTQESDRRRLIDVDEAFTNLMRREHPERLTGVVATPGTERARRVQPEPAVGTRGWAFD